MAFLIWLVSTKPSILKIIISNFVNYTMFTWSKTTDLHNVPHLLSNISDVSLSSNTTLPWALYYLYLSFLSIIVYHTGWMDIPISTSCRSLTIIIGCISLSLSSDLNLMNLDPFITMIMTMTMISLFIVSPGFNFFYTFINLYDQGFILNHRRPYTISLINCIS